MENVTISYNKNYQSLVFVPSKSGKYKLLVDADKSTWYTTELNFEPGYEFMLLGDGWFFNNEEFIRGQLQVIREDGSMDETKSGIIAISINDLENNGNLYTRDEIAQMLKDKLKLVLNQIMDEGFETFNNLIIFSNYFVEKLGQIINLNQSYSDMYRELWYSKEKIWEVLNKDLCIKAWQCLSDYRFGRNVVFNPFLEPVQMEYINLTDIVKKNFQLFSIPYLPVLAESSEANMFAMDGVESFTYSDAKIEYLSKQLYTYKSYSQRALLKSRELLNAVNIVVDQVVEIVDDPKIPVVPEIFVEGEDDKDIDPENNGTTTKKTSSALPIILTVLGVLRLFK